MRAVRSFLFLLAVLGLLAQPSLCRPEFVAGEAPVNWSDGRGVGTFVALEARTDVLATWPGDEGEPESRSVGGGSSDGFDSPTWARSALLSASTPHDGVRAADDRIVLARAFLRVDGSSNARGARA